MLDLSGGSTYKEPGTLRTKSEILDALNDQQKEPVKNYTGPSIIIAGAGSGKTRCIVARASYMVADGVSPENILMFTFTKKAAEEIKERICNEAGQAGNKITVGTYHSFCSRLLRQYAGCLGFRRDFSIYDDEDANKEIRAALDHVKKSYNVPKLDISVPTIRKTISGWKEKMLNPAGAKANVNGPVEELSAQVYEVYQAKLRAYNAMDFDDLIYYVIRLFESNKDALAAVNSQYHYIIADEVQDSSPRDLGLIYYLGGQNMNVCIVGDDAQSIYSFRGANLPTLFSFVDQLNFKQYLLERNYRSTKTIVNAANNVIEENRDQFKKICFSENSNGNKIICFARPDVIAEAEQIKNIVKAAMKNSELWGFDKPLEYKDIAVLFRTNKTSRPIEEAFINSSIPYTMLSGVPFYCREEVKDIMAYIRLLVNPTDFAALQRVINVPKRGIGKVTLEKINSCVINCSDDIISLEKLREVVLSSEGITRTIKNGIENFFSVLLTLEELKTCKRPDELIQELLNLINYREYRETKDSNEEITAERYENIDELKVLAASAASLSDFVENIMLSQEVSDKKEEEDSAVQMLSIHGAKGLEWPIVIIAGAHDDNLPHFASKKEGNIEEERRLFYVAMTRAKKQLFITYPQSVKTRMGPQTEKESRFVSEIESCYLQRA